MPRSMNHPQNLDSCGVWTVEDEHVFETGNAENSQPY